MSDDKPKIEAILKPETVNEVLLIRRIEELKRKLYEAGFFDFDHRSLFAKDRGEIMGDLPSHIRLPLGASAIASREPTGISVVLRAHGEKSFGCAEYVSQDALQRSPLAAARMLDEIINHARHGIANFLKKEMGL